MWVVWIGSRAWMLGALGCGHAVEDGPTDAFLVSLAVGRVSEARSNPRRLEKLFVDGQLPEKDELVELRRYMTKTKPKNVTVDGDTASVDVTFEITATGELLGPTTWTMQRVGDSWRVKELVFP